MTWLSSSQLLSRNAHYVALPVGSLSLPHSHTITLSRPLRLSHYLVTIVHYILGGYSCSMGVKSQDRDRKHRHTITDFDRQCFTPGQNGWNALVFLLHHCFPLAKTVCTPSPV